MQWPVGKVKSKQAKANIPMVTRLLFFPNLNVSFLFPKCVSLLPHYTYSSSTQRREREREREISADFNLERNLVAARAFKKAKAPLGPAIANACMRRIS